MASSPPASPGNHLPQRPMSAMVRPSPRSNSRLSMTSKHGGGSKASDDESRTAVKVAVRVRPPLKPTDPGYELIPQRFQRSMVQVTSNTSLAIDSPQGRKLFVFDRVFGSDVEQEGIWDYLQDCVGAFIQGYNVSLLAYGQSGAGKSYTMGTSGPIEQDDLEVMGVIPRAATALFEKLDGPKKQANRGSMSQLRAPHRYSAQTSSTSSADRTWSLKATYLEIYNEQLRDLLLPDHVPQHERGNVTIREDVKGNIILTGLRQVEINSVEDLMNALNFGSTLRQTDATAINARSSRSHAVFSLNLVQRKSGLQGSNGADKRFSVPIEAMTGSETWVTTDSKLHFVDLAGSERLKNTGAQGERAKEGISINGGLAALGKVISQLSSRQAGSHVSYRDSKLTRLLQDSLGGNAITYMIACVTPAEFHLSETLNTVQYAQRARAIQSKPRIQQVEEGDKQAIIDRLKAEVAFLREQVRSAERGGGERRIASTGERSERQNERESELQNQLLDVQENYTTLSQRHAKLIAEMAKARDNEAAENNQHEESMGDTATERLNRSNSFAAAVEQVVLEYEKTIQTLEQSLSSTRGTLANTEANLLEKETKCTYIETINTQLQARLQKLMDREASTENYLHDLENKLDGHTSGEEKNTTIIVELRKEISRIRENEASCEDYISTLEERLAEADQDAELMQREIDRLEQVIERQRSLGKLDSLLHELDHIQGDSKVPEPTVEAPNGVARQIADHSRSQSQSRVIRMSQNDIIPENAEEEAAAAAEATDPVQNGDHVENGTDVATPDAKEHNLQADLDDYPPHSPAQSKFVHDKLENVTQELIDLRVEHETTVNEYDLLHSKYEEALRTLAELQDTIDESRHPERMVRDSMMSITSPNLTRPPSFFSDARSSDIKDGGQFSSRSLSSELSSAMESPATVDPSDAETSVTAKPESGPEHLSTEDLMHQDLLATEVERFKTLAAEKEEAEKELAEKYTQLELKHHEALDMLEELKTEVAQAKALEASSPRTGQPVIRRKSSQNVMIIDRAHRSFASLRNIATDNFEGQPDVMQNFELNLNAAMHELHARSERIQELEADIASAKKEMETKMALISGLTRERSSLQASPMDMSMISTLKNQLEANEKQMEEMRENHEATEKKLMAELETLRTTVKEAPAMGSSPEATTEAVMATAAASAIADIPMASTEVNNSETRSLPTTEENDKKITELQAELTAWETKHQTALDTLQETETKMKKTIEELESEIVALNTQASVHSTARSAEEVKEIEEKHETLVKSLRDEIDEHKVAINTNANKVSDLEAAHAATKTELDEVIRARNLHETQAKTQQSLITNLENQITAHEQALKTHQDGMKLLQESHAKELEEMKQMEQKGYEEQVAVLLNEHAENVRALECELNDAREDLMKVATQVAFALGLDVSIEKITERIDDLTADQKALGEEQKKSSAAEKQVAELSSVNDNLVKELEQAKSTLTDLLTAEGEPLKSPAPLPDQLSAIRKKITDLQSRNKKNSRLVEELEDQLQSNFDQVQMTNNRLSTLQTERNSQIEEAQAAKFKAESELDSLKAEYAALQAKIDEASASGQIQRSNSVSSPLRKSASVASLPSPPPAIPLPPLPGASSGPNGTVPSTPTQAGRPGSKDNMGPTNQIQEDQEARIRTIEKHLQAEKQLTQTLEEALTDLERQSNKVKADSDAWRKRCVELESEVKELKDRPAPTPQPDNRWSLHAVEEERKKRQAAEAQQRLLEERMNALSKKKKKGSLNCF
ncbi:kinesin motor domain-containing protein [Colletotrichum orchidophilum]|uniref:Kinesin motor domain-containing protein n=1 Tax=Colletotrichum orchidophilum TaxID=1209926 RepID=A0A1G4AW57_9PEZI|nr:kinesin motor domain-containing protein [Colletotrichum orchidophilum]OHE93399.1 kinesin motor domain-containing protein [Colletotrichum orchidophilum]